MTWLDALVSTIFLGAMAAVIWCGALLAIFSAGAPLFGQLAVILIFVGVPLAFVCSLFYVVAPARWKLWFAAVAALIVMLLNVAPWHPRLLFVKRLAAIRPGMTIAQVQKQMAGYSGGEIGDGILTPEQLEYYKATHSAGYRWSTDADYNADVGVVYFEGNRVVRTDFHPD